MFIVRRGYKGRRRALGTLNPIKNNELVLELLPAIQTRNENRRRLIRTPRL